MRIRSFRFRIFALGIGFKGVELAPLAAWTARRAPFVVARRPSGQRPALQLLEEALPLGFATRPESQPLELWGPRPAHSQEDALPSGPWPQLQLQELGNPRPVY